MLDAELKIVDSVTVDVSEGSSQASSPFTIGRSGFSRISHFVVAIEEGSGDNGIDPVSFILQAQTDGTNWFPIAQITLIGDDCVEQKRCFSVPIGLWDFRNEVQGAADIQVRVVVTYTDTAATDDFVYSAYLGGPNPYPPTNVL